MCAKENLVADRRGQKSLYLNGGILTGRHYKTKNWMKNNSVDGSSVSSETVFFRWPWYPLRR